MSVSFILRRDVAPVGSAYLGFLGIFVLYLRQRRREMEEARSGSSEAAALRLRPPALFRLLASMLAGGYLFFAAAILVFYLVLGGQARNFVSQSLAQGAVLAFAVVLPAFAVLTWAEAAVRRRLTSGRREPPGRLPRPG